MCKSGGTPVANNPDLMANSNAFYEQMMAQQRRVSDYQQAPGFMTGSYGNPQDGPTVYDVTSDRYCVRGTWITRRELEELPETARKLILDAQKQPEPKEPEDPAAVRFTKLELD